MNGLKMMTTDSEQVLNGTAQYKASKVFPPWL